MNEEVRKDTGGSRIPHWLRDGLIALLCIVAVPTVNYLVSTSTRQALLEQNDEHQEAKIEELEALALKTSMHVEVIKNDLGHIKASLEKLDDSGPNE